MFVSLQVMRNLRFEGSKFCDSPKTRVIGPSRWRCRWSFLPMSGSRGSRESSHCTEPLYNDPHRSSPWAARQSLPKRQHLTPRLAVDRTHLLIPSDPTTFGRCWYGWIWVIFIKNTQGLSTYCLDAQLLQFYRILGSEFRSIHLFMGKQAPHSQPQRLWLGEAPPCAKTPWPRIAGKIQRRADRIPSALPFRGQKLWRDGRLMKIGLSISQQVFSCHSMNETNLFKNFSKTKAEGSLTLHHSSPPQLHPKLPRNDCSVWGWLLRPLHLHKLKYFCEDEQPARSIHLLLKFVAYKSIDTWDLLGISKFLIFLLEIRHLPRHKVAAVAEGLNLRQRFQQSIGKVGNSAHLSAAKSHGIHWFHRLSSQSQSPDLQPADQDDFWIVFADSLEQ